VVGRWGEKGGGRKKGGGVLIPRGGGPIVLRERDTQNMFQGPSICTSPAPAKRTACAGTTVRKERPNDFLVDMKISTFLNEIRDAALMKNKQHTEVVISGSRNKKKLEREKGKEGVSELNSEATK